MHVLFVDHKDSFTWNLVQVLRELDCTVDVVRPEALASLATPFDRILLGPGPGGPDECVASRALLMQHGQEVPVLGVCLGHQILGRAFGGNVARAAEPVHGFGELIEHDELGLFERVPSPVRGARYHSLVVLDPLPDELVASARSTRGEIMALRHRHWPVESVQFHPESVLSEHGHTLLSNFVAGAIGSRARPSGAVQMGHGPLDGRRGSSSNDDGHRLATRE